MATLPVTVDLTAYRGDTWQQPFRLLEGPVPVDLTGAEVAAWARNGTATVELDATIGTAAGMVTIALPEDAPAGRYRYDVEVTAATVVTTWVRGLLQIVDDVTHNPHV